MISEDFSAHKTRLATNIFLVLPEKKTNSNEKMLKSFQRQKVKKSNRIAHFSFQHFFFKMGVDSPENFYQVFSEFNFKMLKGYLGIFGPKNPFIAILAAKKLCQLDF